MSELACCEATPAMQKYKRSIRTAAAGYTVTLLLAITFIKAFPATPWKYAVMLVPVIPACWGVVATLRAVRAMDELQRRVHLEGVSFSFVITVVIMLGWGLMERAGLPPIPNIWVASGMIGLWGVGNHLAAKRYR